MLKRKALRKIFVTTLTVVILLTIYFIPSKGQIDEKLKLETSVEYQDVAYSTVYLLNEKDQLVKTKLLVSDTKDIQEKVRSCLEKLILSNEQTIPIGLKSLLPKNTKIINILLEGDTATIDFSKELLEVEDSFIEKIVEAISYTVFDISVVEKVYLLIEGKSIHEYFNGKIPEIVTRDFGINKRYHDINSLAEIQKVVIYYVDEIHDENYYVPVTKYVNDDRDKIKIIVEDLSSSYIYEPNLISYLNRETELINYEIDEDVMTLNFNNSIFMGEGVILEEVAYTISYSVFDNYKVEEVVFMVDSEKIVKKVSKDIE